MKNLRLHCIFSNKIFTLKSLMFPLKTLKKVCSSQVRLGLKIPRVQIHTLESYLFILVTKLKILVLLFLKEKMVK